MSIHQMKITLLSDLCVADGSVYNSMIDVECVRDRFGLPFIPAKRIKGVLRECAIELKDWGTDIDLESIFGKEGEQEKQGKLRISDAKLEDYQTFLDEIQSNPKSAIFHPQNVLNTFSYIRTQTSIEYATGVAKKHSLRTMRVLHKGLVFVGNVEIEESPGAGQDKEQNGSESILNQLEEMCKLFTHFGMARTRGLGDVKVEFIANKGNTKGEAKESDNKNHTTEELSAESDLPGKTAVLEYIIQLQEPMVLKSAQRGEMQTMDYIEGSKVIGLLAKTIKERDGAAKGNETFLNLLNQGDDDLVFGNAYLAKKSGKEEENFSCESFTRLTEVPAYLYNIKDNKKNYINKLHVKDEELHNIIVNSMKHSYVYENEDKSLLRSEVSVLKRYHHRRPEDKGYGHVVKDDKNTLNGEGGNLYVLSSIEEGQVFKGFIKGEGNAVQEIYKILKDVSTAYMGYGSRSEYGKVRFSIAPVDKSNPNYANTSVNTRRKMVVAKLDSPVILYNRQAMYSTAKEDLKHAILRAITGKDDESLGIKKEQHFIRYVRVGGFNTTWNRRKPNIVAFDKGTTMVFELENDMEIQTGIHFIGERVMEGFGELKVSVVEPESHDDGNKNRLEKYRILRREEHDSSKLSDSAHKVHVCEGKLSDQISGTLFSEYLRYRAIETVANARNVKRSWNSTVSNMLSICDEVLRSESKTLQAVGEAVRKRYDKTGAGKEEKLKNGKAIFELLSKEILKEKSVKNEAGEDVKKWMVDEVVVKALSEGLVNDFSEKYYLTGFSSKETDLLHYLQFVLQELKYKIRSEKKTGGGADE